MTNPVNVRSSAFNVERVRAEMMQGVRMPPDLFQKAIDKTYEKLTAKKTQFFSFQGQVCDQREVEDHQTQLAAVEKVLGIAGVYVRERDVAAPPLSVALEMDPKTGVVRLVVGSLPPLEPLASQLPYHDASIIEHDVTVSAVASGESVVDEPKSLAQTPSGAGQQIEEKPPQIIKVKQGNMSKKLYKELFGEEDGSN